jgi:RES domain-containing protein
MLAYRLVKAKHAVDAFNGEGARINGGRWNPVGTPMVYAAESRALATLESLVHFSGGEKHIPFVLYTIEIPDDCIEVFDPKRLPKDWNNQAPPASLQTIGGAWQQSQRTAALLVPSALIKAERCVLLNPSHDDTRRILINYPEPFAFDPRLLREEQEVNPGG